MKWCPRCSHYLKPQRFNKNKNRGDGLNGYCRDCQNKCNKKYRQTEKGKITSRKQNKSEAHRKSSRKCSAKFMPTYNIIHRKETTARNKLKWLFAKYINRDDFVCAICSKQPVETHHENYDLWYVFIPLCRKCHLNIGVNKL